MPRCLIITNDFPPRQGGIETFVHEPARRFPPGEVVVHTSAEPGAEAFDAGLPFPVVRDRARVLLPTPRVARTARELISAYGCDRVWFGAAAPLGLLAGHLGGVPSVATTHGHEAWWAAVPGARQILRRIGDRAGTVTYLTEHTRARIEPALGPRARTARLVPGVVFTGGRPHGALPPFYAAADVFAMPCRTRRLGLETEGLGIVFLEAAASGLPVLAGDSGGAAEAVLDGETGHVVDPASVPEIAGRLVALLTDPAARSAMGERGRAWAEAEWTWDSSYRRLRDLLLRASRTVGA